MDTKILFNISIKRVLSAFSLYGEKDNSAKRFNRERWAIMYKYEGKTVYENKGQELSANEDTIVILPKGCNYEWRCLQSGRFYALEFDCEQICDTVFSFPVKNKEKLLQLFMDIEKKMALREVSNNLEILKNSYSLLIQILNSTPKKYLPLSTQEKLAPAINYLMANYNRPVRNDELASLCSLSTVYFRKLFTKAFGLSPITYLHELRVKKAKEMLLSDFDSISALAFSLGYPSLYDFSRTFKKHTGVSPSAFLKERQR